MIRGLNIFLLLPCIIYCFTLGTTTISGNLGNTGLSNLAAAYSAVQDVYCVSGTDGLNCYDGTSHALLASHTFDGNAFWMWGYEGPSYSGVVFCTDRFPNSEVGAGIFTLDLDRSRITNTPIQRISGFTDNLQFCAIDLDSMTFYGNVDVNGFFRADQWFQVDVGELNPNITGGWNANTLTYNENLPATYDERENFNAIITGPQPNQVYVFSGAEGIGVLNQGISDTQYVRYAGGDPSCLISSSINNFYLWVGTTIGLVWQIDTRDGGVKNVVIALDYNIQNMAVDSNEVLFVIGQNVNGNNGRLFRVNGQIDGTVVDFVDIPTTARIGAVALDEVGQRVFVFTEDQQRFEVSYGNCNSFTLCTECLDQAMGDPIYCDWCYDDGSCERNGQCTNPLGSNAPSESNQNNCASITNISPSSGVGGTNITLSLSNNAARPELGLLCNFQGSTSSGVLNPSNDQLTCTTPLNGMDAEEVNITYSDGTTLFTQNAQIFAFISCSSSLTCASCAATSACEWCLDTVTCENMGVCSTTSISTSSNCPVFAPFSPLSNPAGNSFSVDITSGPFVDNGGTYELILTPGSTVIPVSFNSTSRLIGMVPSLSANNYQARLERAGNDYFSGIQQPLFIFDCLSITDCETCADNTINCIWCTDDQLCRGPSDSCMNSATITPDGQCPSSNSVNPPSSFTSGLMTPLTISTSGLFPIGMYNCSFGGSLTPATRTNNLITCGFIPSTASPGSVSLDVLLNMASPPIISTSFLYFSCGGFVGSCSDCLNPVLGGACEFCFEDGSCSTTGTGSCTSPFSSCPSISSISPQGIDVSDIESVTFTFSTTIPDISQGYECSWGPPASVVTTGMRTSTNTIACNSPPGDLGLIGTPPDPTFYNVPVDIQTNDSMSIFIDSSSISIFNCPSIGINDCASCSALPFCGLCLGPNACTSLSVCIASGGIQNLWLDANRGCPLITSIDPDHASISGGNIITVSGSLFLVDNLECRFAGQDDTPATRLSESQLQCDAPPGTAFSSTNLSIIQSQITYSANSFEFNYVDCSPFTDCESCIFDTTNSGRCGWCLTTATCSPTFDCPAGDWQTSACPSIISITPGFAERGDRIDFEILGTLFRPGLEVLFDQEPATEVAVVSDTSITGRSPAIDQVGPISVTLSINGNSYSSASTSFNAIPPSSQGANAGLAAGVAIAVFCVFCCCVGCVFWLLYVRTKNILARRTVKIVEPKWDIIAYSNWLNPIYKGKSLRDYEDFIQLFIGTSSQTLLLSLESTTQTTEQDSLARAVTYIHCDRANGIDLILSFIEYEVESAVQLEGKETLFRANSLTTKMFKYYAKIVGTRYLFNILARFVAEMELSHKLQLENTAELNTLQDMELDPTKMEPDEDELQIQENKTNLISFSQKILNAILRSTSSIPSPILKIILKVRDIVDKTFSDPDCTFKSIGSFFFLRLVCPAIAAPESYFRDDAPEPYVRRQLVLVSKMLQNLANNVQFGGKEQFMAPLNPFITDNIENLRKFYSKMTHDTNNTPDIDVPEDPIFNSACFLHNHIQNSKVSIEKDLTSSDKYQNGPEVWRKLKFELQNLDTVPEKIKKKN